MEGGEVPLSDSWDELAMQCFKKRRMNEQSYATTAGRVGAERRIETKQRRSLDFDTGFDTPSATQPKSLLNQRFAQNIISSVYEKPEEWPADIR